MWESMVAISRILMSYESEGKEQQVTRNKYDEEMYKESGAMGRCFTTDVPIEVKLGSSSLGDRVCATKSLILPSHAGRSHVE